MSKKRTYDDLPKISREDARDQGLSQFFTGEPCVQGHVAPRMVRDNHCLRCLRNSFAVAMKKRREANPEAYLQYQRDYKHRFPAKAMFMNVRSRAQKRGIEFTITLSDIVIAERCPCCNQQMEMRSGPAVHGPTHVSPSLDRVNPNLGYVPGNVAVICWRCNNLKRDATISELEMVLAWMRSTGSSDQKHLKLVS